ncbi:uncharacterized protein GGS25DRAFT_471817 [Hypoxylon fragiforme]|uniref:uncharacterized protein n=1 Tax=Hypoxylon fragiforme TaxID=63214 RepID=UPI0020C71947|nr:uncharacterized protein GGS25DRAFT_471817 [Hypoxylon fragiforme]KAI2614459.1 hypothetical protein GGS25DRAFT_471817 [Hypoxylon fragiforme]
MAGTTSSTSRQPSRFRTWRSGTSFHPSPSRGYSAQPPRGPNNAVKFWPFAAIIAMGSAGYVLLARSRAESRNVSARRAG